MTSKENAPAKLVDGEPLITEELAEKYKEAVTKQQLKIDESKEDNGVISAPNKPGAGGKKKSSIGGAADSKVIGSAGAKASAKPVAKTTQKKATVALYSDRNVHWSGVGKLEKGYNIVSKEQAARWLTRNHVREATPEEVASEYGA